MGGWLIITAQVSSAPQPCMDMECLHPNQAPSVPAGAACSKACPCPPWSQIYLRHCMTEIRPLGVLACPATEDAGPGFWQRFSSTSSL